MHRFRYQRSRRLSYLLSFSLPELFPPLPGSLRDSRAPLPGDYMPGVPPVPIPNTAVKPRAANGSWTSGPARVGRCQVYGPVLLIEVSGLFAFIPLPPPGLPFLTHGHRPTSYPSGPATPVCGILIATSATSQWSPLRRRLGDE